MTQRNTTVESEFIEKLGLLIEAEGLPRIAGRIMGLMLLTPTPCHAADLARDLRISHGSVSTNTRLLERLGIVEKVLIPGERAAAFRLAPDPYGSLLTGQLERMRKFSRVLSDTRRILAPDRSDGRKRLAQMEKFYRLAIRSTEDLLDSWESKTT